MLFRRFDTVITSGLPTYTVGYSCTNYAGHECCFIIFSFLFIFITPCLSSRFCYARVHSFSDYRPVSVFSSLSSPHSIGVGGGGGGGVGGGRRRWWWWWLGHFMSTVARRFPSSLLSSNAATLWSTPTTVCVTCSRYADPIGASHDFL